MPNTDRRSIVEVIHLFMDASTCRDVIHSVIEVCYRKAAQYHGHDSEQHVGEHWRAVGQSLTAAEHLANSLKL